MMNWASFGPLGLLAGTKVCASVCVCVCRCVLSLLVFQWELDSDHQTVTWGKVRTNALGLAN